MNRQSRLDAYHFYEQEWADIQTLRDNFHWECPDEFNLTTYTCDRWADGSDRVAIHDETHRQGARTVTYDDLSRQANSLAAFLQTEGVEPGDRVGVCLPPRPAVLVGHLAAWKLGAVSVPLNTLFGPDALAYRLSDCDVSACLAGHSTIDSIRTVASDIDSLDTIVPVGSDPTRQEVPYETIQTDYQRSVDTPRTDPEDDAIIIYTSGTTGDPKGVLHAHRFLLGVLPVMCRCFLPDHSTDGQLWWTPVDWSWIGSLGAMLAGLYYGIELLAYDRGQFDPETAFELLEKHDVTWFGGPPTMLRMMKTVDRAGERFDVDTLQVIGSGGGKIDQATIDWADDVFDGATVQDTYGQTETGGGTNIADFAPLVPVRRDSIGVALPGNDVRIVDPDTHEPLDTGEVGEIAVNYDGNLSCFKRYWNLPEQTEQKVQNGWLYTEDLGTVDEDGYFSFETRKDDVIISSGYRISPEEIEETLAEHDRVADAGVIGVPHDTRGEIPRAYVTLEQEPEAPETLKQELQSFVKTNLAKYEYPRELEFIDELPLTNTGKLSRHRLRNRAGLADE